MDAGQPSPGKTVFALPRYWERDSDAGMVYRETVYRRD